MYSEEVMNSFLGHCYFIHFITFAVDVSPTQTYVPLTPYPLIPSALLRGHMYLSPLTP